MSCRSTSPPAVRIDNPFNFSYSSGITVEIRRAKDVALCRFFILLKVGVHTNLLYKLHIKWGPSWNESCDSSTLAILLRLGSFEILISVTFFIFAEVIDYHMEHGRPTAKPRSTLMNKDNLRTWLFSQSKIISSCSTSSSSSDFSIIFFFPVEKWETYSKILWDTFNFLTSTKPPSRRVQKPCHNKFPNF